MGIQADAHEALFRAYIQNAAHYPLREEAMEIYAAPWRGEIGQAAFYRQIAQADTRHIEDVQKLYKKPEFKVHLIWGEHDAFIPLEQGRELQGLLDADSFTVIHNAAHIVHEDAPEAIVGALLQNLSWGIIKLANLVPHNHANSADADSSAAGFWRSTIIILCTSFTIIVYVNNTGNKL